MNSALNRRSQPSFFFFSPFLKFNFAAIPLSRYSVSTALGVRPAEGALDSGKRAQWPIENEMKKQTCYPSSPSLPSSLPSPTPSIPGGAESWKSNKPLPVCPGITVCDFSLTSQAALWHGGVIVSGGWKPFCHGRVEKDKATPHSILSRWVLRHCLTCAGGGRRLAHERKVQARGKTPPLPASACLPTAWDRVRV